MHIPDGYLGPYTYLGFYIVMLPLWFLASKKARLELSVRQAPIVGIAAAFSFVIMMFNIPLPGGSSGHITGGALMGIVLGPWAGMIAETVTLFVQALFFGDGGVTSFAANCFNMAFLMPFCGYYIFKLMSLGGASQKRKVLGAFTAGYISINIAAFFTGVEFGIQPLLHKTAAGQPLYAPYSLSVSLPAMMAPHLLIFGFIEAFVTASVAGYLIRHAPGLIYRGERVESRE